VYSEAAGRNGSGRCDWRSSGRNSSYDGDYEKRYPGLQNLYEGMVILVSRVRITI